MCSKKICTCARVFVGMRKQGFGGRTEIGRGTTCGPHSLVRGHAF